MTASGIRVTVALTDPEVCPIAACSTATDMQIDTVSRSVSVDESPAVSEFSLGADRMFDEQVTQVFSDGTTYRYRIEHDDHEPSCPCEVLGSFGIPVTRYTVRQERLTLVFHVTDYDQLQGTIGELQDRFPSLDIRRFIKAPVGETPSAGVLVDTSRLTSRQEEVLQTAFEMGYFEHPRRTNATEVAAALDINSSTFREHLQAAESKIFQDVLQE